MHHPDDVSANVNEDLAKDIAEEYFDLCATTVQKYDGYDDLNYYLAPPIHAKTKRNVDLHPHGYLMKIINSRESQNVGFITEYVNVLLHLNSEKITCPKPFMNKSNEYFSIWTDTKGLQFIVIVLTYQNGDVLRNCTKYSESLCRSLGNLVSHLHLKLLPFCNSHVLKRPDYPWSLENVLRILDLLKKIDLSEERKQLIAKIVNEFQKQVLPQLDKLEMGIIHNDVTDKNILVKGSTETNKFTICGIIDFSDMLFSAYLFEFAITSCYICLNNPEQPINLIASFLAGYVRRPLEELEYTLLKTCICARICQSLVMGLHTYSLNPTNQYVLITQQLGWKMLYTLLEIENEDFVRKLKDRVNSIRMLHGDE